ncbi:MAG: DNA polymerase III subunit delta [Bacilli bacterium]|nr:DNA polymerase III subunit delta [Bacilli bacterium]
MNNNLFLIISSDKSVIDFNLHKILKKINYEENSKILLDMQSKTILDVIEEASMINLFSKTKVVIASNYDIDKSSEEDLEYLDKYSKNYNKDVYIIIIANKIDTRKKSFKVFKENFNVINNSELNTSNINEYITNIVKEKQYKINSYDIEYFISKVGYDINNINNELNKLFIYKEKEKAITREDIDLLIMDNIENIMYEFTNAILDNNYDKITVMYNNFKKEDIGPDYLIASIAGSLRTNLIIKLLKNNGLSNYDIANVIGKKEFFVKKSLERLYQYTINDLTNSISKLAMIDRNLKNGKSNIDELEFFILNR